MIRSVLTAVLLLATAAAMGAADTDAPAWYDVEVLVFKNNSSAGDELWPADPGHPDLEHAVELVPVAQTVPLPGAPQPFQQLDATSFTLKTAESRLAASPSYRPLLHLAWRQSASAQADAPAVHLHTDSAGAKDESGTDGGRTLDGSIRISRNRFLHVDVDLLYRDAGSRTASSGAGGGDSPVVFRLQQSRRINSGEVHYFDHPAFGLLVKVTPYDASGQKGGGKAR
jgi:hypothetical protein